MNIAHLYSKTKQKVNFISDLCNLNTLFLCFCETWLKDDILDSETQIPGFSLIRCDRKVRAGGGVCVYLRHSVGFDTCLNYSNSVCEVLVLRLHQPSPILVLLYRPPSCSAVDFKDAIYQLEQFFSKEPSPLPNIILLGDFNFPDIDWSCPDISYEAAAPLLSLSNSLLLNQQVDKPTRLSNTLDLIFCPDELIKSISVADTYLSDHRILTTSTLIPLAPTKTNLCSNPPASAFEKLDFNKSDWPNLCLSLKSIDFSVFESDQPIDVCIDDLFNNIANVCSNHVPLKRPKKSTINKFHRERKTLMRRTKLHKKSTPCPKVTQELIDIESAICSSHRDEKLSEESRAVAKIKVDPKYFFRFAKKSSICKTDIGPLRNIQTNCLTDDKHEMCKLLLDHFDSVFTTPDPTKIVLDPNSFFTNPPVSDTSCLTDINFSESVIIDAIRELSPNSAAGPDGIPSSLLINCASEIAPLLRKLFTASFLKGYIPPSFKRAAIVPIFKSGDKCLPGNYRPISLTSVICKVYERIIRKQVFSFLCDKNCLNDTQHGFRSGRSCLSALLDVYDDVMHMLNGDSIVDMVYLDFAKAFDKVDHGILLHKVKDLGITGKLGQWFYHFLTNRKHFVRLPGGLSEDHPVISGVPQGTVLGPLLFIIMIADINRDVDSSKLISFADDTRVYRQIADITFLLAHPKPQTKVTYTLILLWTLSRNLLMSLTLVLLCLNTAHLILTFLAYPENAITWLAGSFVSRDRLTMLTLFKSLVISRLDYASQLWSPHKISQITQIEKVQRSFTKHITGLCDLSYHERLQTLKLYSLQRRRERYCIILIWKILENKSQNLSDPILCNFSDRRGRSCAISHVDPGRLGTLAYNSFRWRAIRLFNSLPKTICDIKNCSVCSFKLRPDHYLSSIPDLPCSPGYNNSLNGGDYLQWWTPRDDLVAG